MIKQPRVLGTFSLAMITVAAIISLRNLPMTAEYGLSSIFYLVTSALLFFIPIALATAELATGWPKAGGNYIWVGEAFGKNWGFFALWNSWMESIAWFPAILAFTAAMLGHLLAPVFPGLEHSKFFILTVMLVVFWGSTFINFLGIETSSIVTSIGVVTGTLIPGILIIGLGIWWVMAGHPSHIVWSWDALIPDFKLNNMVFFSGILLSLAGAELAAFHIRETENPQKNFPRALGLASFLILVITILGTLAIAVVVPQEKISLLSGIIQAFTVFFEPFQWAYAVPVMAFFALIGSLAGINTWTVGPAKGLLVTAEDGFLPPPLKKVNQHGVPTGMLLFQALIGTLLSFVFLWMDSHSAAYWILTALSAQFTVVQYGLVFAAVVRLRYSKPEVFRAFKVPGGKIGIWSVAILGMTSCLFGFWIVFLPPAQLETGDQTIYQTLLAVSLIILSLIPVLLILHRKKQKRKDKR